LSGSRAAISDEREEIDAVPYLNFTSIVSYIRRKIVTESVTTAPFNALEKTQLKGQQEMMLFDGPAVLLFQLL
jgi:hypothetical protein